MQFLSIFLKRQQKIATAQCLARYLAIFYPARIAKIEENTPQIAQQLNEYNQSHCVQFGFGW